MFYELQKLGLKAESCIELIDRPGERHFLWGVDLDTQELFLEFETNFQWVPLISIKRIDGNEVNEDLIKQIILLSDNLTYLGVNWLDKTVLKVLPKYKQWEPVTPA